MKVKIMKAFVLHNGKSWDVGSIADIDDVDAKPLLRIGFVAPVRKSAVETAVKEPVVETREKEEE